MPHLALPANPRDQVDQYSVAFWVGMDGVVSDAVDPFAVRGLWQAGFIMSIWTNGSVEYKGFHQWVPENPVFLSADQMSASEGDHIYVSVGTSSAGFTGTVSFINLNNHQSYYLPREAPHPPRGPIWRAPGSSAQWIMEAGTYVNGPQFILPDWGNATMLEARAYYSNGREIGAGDANPNPENTIMQIIRHNETEPVKTESYADGQNVWIAYVE